MVKAQLLTAALQDDKAALQTIKGTAKTVVVLDYAHSDDFEKKKYRIVSTLAPVFAALLDNVPVVDGQDYTQFVAGIALQGAMQTPLAKVESIITGHSFKYAQYANFVAAAPAIAIEEDQQIVATAQSNEEAYDEVTLTDDQVAGVLDMGLPEVKATASGLELHFVDALPLSAEYGLCSLNQGPVV